MLCLLQHEILNEPPHPHLVLLYSEVIAIKPWWVPQLVPVAQLFQLPPDGCPEAFFFIPFLRLLLVEHFTHLPQCFQEPVRSSRAPTTTTTTTPARSGWCRWSWWVCAGPSTTKTNVIPLIDAWKPWPFAGHPTWGTNPVGAVEPCPWWCHWLAVGVGDQDWWWWVIAPSFQPVMVLIVHEQASLSGLSPISCWPMLPP